MDKKITQSKNQSLIVRKVHYSETLGCDISDTYVNKIISKTNNKQERNCTQKNIRKRFIYLCCIV